MGTLTRSVGRRNIIRPVVMEGGSDKCRLVTNRHHLETTRLTKLIRVPTLIHSCDSRRATRVTLVRGLRHRSLGPLRRKLTCRQVVDRCRFARRGVTGLVNGDHSCIAGVVQLLRLSRRMGDLLLRQGLATKRTHPLLKLRAPTRRVALTHQVIRRSLSTQHVRRVLHHRGSKRGQGPTSGTSTCLHTLRRSLIGTMKSHMGVGIKGKGGDRENAVSVSFGDSGRFRHVAGLLGRKRWVGP